MKIYLYILILLVFVSCQNEENAPLGFGNTYMKFVGSNASHVAVNAIKNEDGSIAILANITEIKEDEPKRWIKLIEIDRSGNIIGQPKSFEYNIDDTYTQYIAYDFFRIENGYLITGESINEAGSSLLLIKVEESGSEVKTFPMADFNLKGKGLQKNSADEIILLAEKSLAQDKWAIYLKVDLNTLSVSEIENAQEPINKLTNGLVRLGNELLYANSTLNSSQTQINLNIIGSDYKIRSSPSIDGVSGTHRFLNRIATINDHFIGIGETSTEATFEEEVASDRILFINDIQQVLNITGNIYEKNIFTVPVDDTSTPGLDAATGYAVTGSNDDNFVILGAIGNEEGERSLVIQKVDLYGNPLWDGGRIYGGSGEVGAAVLQTNDGGYFVLSTTYYGDIASLLILKTDANGNL